MISTYVQLNTQTEHSYTEFPPVVCLNLTVFWTIRSGRKFDITVRFTRIDLIRLCSWLFPSRMTHGYHTCVARVVCGEFTVLPHVRWFRNFVFKKKSFSVPFSPLCRDNPFPKSNPFFSLQKIQTRKGQRMSFGDNKICLLCGIQYYFRPNHNKENLGVKCTVVKMV